MERFKKNLADAARVAVIALAITLGVQYLFAATWTNPPLPPPNGNVEAPINVGTNSQAKQGGLSLGTASLPTSPSLLRVHCSTGDCAGKVLTSDADGNSSWQLSSGNITGGCYETLTRTRSTADIRVYLIPWGNAVSANSSGNAVDYNTVGYTNPYNPYTSRQSPLTCKCPVGYSSRQISGDGALTGVSGNTGILFDERSFLCLKD